MKCPKCNASYKSELKCCPKCGYLFNSDDVKKYSDLFNSDLLEVYYPIESKTKERRYSLYYAFFTFYYAIYKRMYECAIYTILGFLLFIKVFPQTLSIILDSGGFYFFLVLSILAIGLAPYFYYMYNFDRLLADRRKMKINKIIKKNPDKSNEEIKELVTADSKNNFTGLIIAILITVGIIIFKLLKATGTI